MKIEALALAWRHNRRANGWMKGSEQLAEGAMAARDGPP